MVKKKLSLFIFIDAFGWEILRSHSFLRDILVTQVPLQTIFGYSSTCDPTILTGKLPREHGHFSFFYYNPQASPFSICRMLSILPRSITRRGRVRRILSRFLARYYGYSGYFQIYNMPFRHLALFDYSEKRDLYQPGGINSGDRTIFDDLRERGIPFYLSDWRLKEEKNIASLAEALKRKEIVFAYLYMAAMDAILHQYGTQSPAVTEKILWYERQIREIYNLASAGYDPIHLYIFSDHGMTDITKNYDLMTAIQSLNLRFGIDYVAVYDSTMARFWFLKEEARRKIVDVLKQQDGGEILSDEKLAEYGCDFANRKYGELFFLLKPGVLLCPSFMSETSLKGMHGYAPEHKDSYAMFASNITPPYVPKRLDDLYSVMKQEIS